MRPVAESWRKEGPLGNWGEQPHPERKPNRPRQPEPERDRAADEPRRLAAAGGCRPKLQRPLVYLGGARACWPDAGHIEGIYTG